MDLNLTAPDVYFIRHVEHSASKYNIKRIVKLITALVITLIVILMLFANRVVAVESYDKQQRQNFLLPLDKHRC